MADESLLKGCRGCGCALLVGLASVIIVVGCLIAWRAVAVWYHMSVPERVTFAIPGTDFEVEHSRILSHPLVAEYNRDVTYIARGARGKTTPLYIDTCGGYPINCYLIKSPTKTFLRLDDAVSEHLLDLTSQVTYVMNERLARPMSALTEDSPETYIGRLDGKLGRLRFVPASESPEIKIKHLSER